MDINMSNLEMGRVKCYDALSEWGFIENVFCSEDYFLHIKAGRPIVIRNGKPAFAESSEIVVAGLSVGFRPPTTGESVVFHIIPPRNMGKYEQASPWGYKDALETALADIEKLSGPPCYRIIRIKAVTNERWRNEIAVLWMGTDREESRAFFAPIANPPFYKDPLTGKISRNWIEMLTDQGWIGINDPRFKR
jgi:hypothetical protein